MNISQDTIIFFPFALFVIWSWLQMKQTMLYFNKYKLKSLNLRKFILPTKSDLYLVIINQEKPWILELLLGHEMRQKSVTA